MRNHYIIAWAGPMIDEPRYFGPYRSEQAARNVCDAIRRDNPESFQDEQDQQHDHPHLRTAHWPRRPTLPG
jgi:excinuclease UvrABC nuclease subunit